VSSKKLRFFLTYLGNLLEHYDSALFTLFIPFFSQKLFPQDPLSLSLLKGFSLLPLTLFSKPLGAIFFSWISSIKSKEYSLKLSYVGMALVTFSLSLIPLDSAKTPLFPLLVSVRLLQGFFSGGETINGAMYVMFESKSQNKGFLSGLFDASSLGGFLFASILMSVLQSFDCLDRHWRLLFMLGSLCFIPALFLKKPNETSEIPRSFPVFSLSRNLSFLKVFINCGVSYMFFHMCFTFSNSAFCLFNKISQPLLQKQTSYLIAIDIILLPFFGLLANRFKLEQLMKWALLLAIAIIPLSLTFVKNLSPSSIFLVRLLWVTIGALFSANLYVYYNKLFPGKDGALPISIATSLGSALLGHCFSSLALYTFNMFSHPASVGILFSSICFLNFFFVEKKLEKKSYLV
jgi:MFS transporter, MHS family, proline/betaine transporter